MSKFFSLIKTCIGRAIPLYRVRRIFNRYEQYVYEKVEHVAFNRYIRK
ncbi:MAG: hypothetical protein HQK83_05860 [Fibrobacteria bacterium]|nr:hypothetical protein [Fibrobacteria bacterium]